MFVSQAKYDGAIARAQKAEGTIAAIAALFGDEAQAEGFDLLTAIKSLSAEAAAPVAQATPNAKLAALATKYNVEVEGEGDDAVVEALEKHIEGFAKDVPAAVAPKATEEKTLETAKQREITPFEASVLAELEREKKYATPVLD